jgi:hypothetical protein
MGMLSRFLRRFRVVTYELPQNLTEPPEKVSRESMASLIEHPAFQNLLYRMKVQRAVFEQALEKSSHKELADVYRLQAHIQATKWLEKESLSAVKAPLKAKPVEVVDELQRALDHAHTIIEEVGR